MPTTHMSICIPLVALVVYLRVHFPCEYPQEENTNIGSKRMAHGTNVKIMYSILESYDFIFFRLVNSYCYRRMILLQ